MTVLFARVGWMRWYRGPQAGDEKPIGGGKFNRGSLGHEAFNFLPTNGKVLGYFQPQLQPEARQEANPSTIALERIEDGFTGDSIRNVLTVFFATDPEHGGQKIVGWFRSSTVYRYAQDSRLRERNRFSYFIEAAENNAVLVPADRRDFTLPRGKGGAGTSNVCYALEQDGKPKSSEWIADALAYIDSYALENAAEDPASETDAAIADGIASTLENAGGFQSNPIIRRAIEKYAMKWAERELTNRKYPYRDTHKNKPYDFVCKIKGAEVFVEVKGMQDNGRAISLTPREVQHAKKNNLNFALIIVHSVKVKGKREPKVSGGELVFIHPWDINEGTLKPRGFVLTLPMSPAIKRIS